jgi:MurNAc alpha-1-phosphate uridylyltransferase
MIFAAGFGTRMQPLTNDMPKPLIKVAGKALLDHAISLANDATLEKIVVNTHYFPDQIQTHLHETNTIISHEIDSVLDTGGGLKNALGLLGDGPVFTMNSDAVWTGENPFEQLRRAWNPDQMDALLLLSNPMDAAGHKGKGSFLVGTRNALTRGDGAVFLGAQIIKTGLVKDMPQDVFSLNAVWDQMIENGRVYGTFHSGGWCDVGYPEAIPIAESLLKNV